MVEGVTVLVLLVLLQSMVVEGENDGKEEEKDSTEARGTRWTLFQALLELVVLVFRGLEEEDIPVVASPTGKEAAAEEEDASTKPVPLVIPTNNSISIIQTRLVRTDRLPVNVKEDALLFLCSTCIVSSIAPLDFSFPFDDPCVYTSNQRFSLCGPFCYSNSSIPPWRIENYCLIELYTHQPSNRKKHPFALSREPSLGSLPRSLQWGENLSGCWHLNASIIDVWWSIVASVVLPRVHF